MSTDQLHITRVIRTLTSIMAALAVINVGIMLVIRLTGHDSLLGLIPLFDLNEEQNIPTLFAAILWLGNAFAMLLLAVYRAKGWIRMGWMGFAGVALYMAYDELFAVHEHWDAAGGRLAQSLIGSTPYFAWIFIGGLAVCGVVLIGAIMFRYLDPMLRIRLALAGALFVTGAVGLEWFEGKRVESHGRQDLPFHVLVLCEEIMEMSATILALRACLLEMRRQELRLEIT